MASHPISVRPAKRCLGDLEVGLPDLDSPLNEIEDPVIASAQAVPAKRDAGGAERIVSLTDRVWFKVKTADRRAVVTELRAGEISDGLPPEIGAWWIGASGGRQNDSPQRDFCASLKRDCTSGSTVSTDGLLPRAWDWNRLIAEQSVAWRREMKRMVIKLVATSLKTGRLAIAEFQTHRIMALVRTANGHEGYLAIVAEGVPDPQIITLLLDCVPGITRDDWQPEPSSVAGMTPGPGEVIWSTLFPAEVASAVLSLDNE